MLNEHALTVPDATDTPFVYHDILFTPVYNRKFGHIKAYEAMHRNLRIQLFPDSGKLLITNSIHKYALGNNYTDFSHSQLTNAFACLSDELQMDIKSGIISSMEYGIVIPTGSDLQPHKSLLSYKSKSYQPMIYKGQHYGSNCVFTDYNIKGYNKTLEVQLHDKQQIEAGLFRWEVVVKKKRYLHSKRPQIPIFTVSDLLQPDKLQYLAHDLVMKFKDSTKKQSINFDTLDINELTAISRMEHAEVREVIRRNNSETFRKARRKYEAIQKVHTQQSSQVERLLIEKCTHLLNS